MSEVDCQVASESNTGSDRLELSVFAAKIHLRPVRIMWYRAVTPDTISGCHQLPRRQTVRCKAIVWQGGVSKNPYQRYNKQVPGHHISIDVKFLIF